MRFTGKERDAETGLDYFGARYYSGAIGRWSSPDVINVTADRLVSPSNTLNKYVYGGNNPLKFVDPDGRDITLFYQAGFPTGHVMLAAHNPSNNDFALLSVGPKVHHDPKIPLNPVEGVPGTSAYNLPQSVDELRQFSSLTIQTTPEVAQQAINAIRNGAGTGNWALLGNNCTSACAKVLQDLGLSPGSTVGLPWTPAKFWANIYLLHGRRHSGRWYSGLIGNTSGNTMDAPHKPGVDYGNPRFNINTFDFIMLQLKAPLSACVTVYGSDGKPDTRCE